MPPPSVPLAAIRQPAFLYDAGGRVVEANDLAESLAGRPLTGCTAAEIIATFSNRHPDSAPFVPGTLPPTRALAGEDLVDLPMMVTAADGRVIHLLVTASPIRDGAAIAGALVIWQDISAQKRIEEAFRESGQRQAFLLALGDRLRELDAVQELMVVAAEMVGRHLGANGVVYCDIDEAGECATVRADWNDGTVPSAAGRFRMDDFGIGDLYRRGGIRRTSDVTTALDEEAAGEHCALRIRSSLGVPVRRGEKLSAVLAVHSSLKRDWTDAEVELVREAGDRIWSAVERAKADEALQASEDQYRTLFTSIDEGFVIDEVLFDQAGKVSDVRILATNPSFDRMMQVEDPVGRTSLEIFPHAEASWFEAYGEVVATGVARRFENYLAALDRWFELYVSRIGGEGSRFIAIVFKDVTDRKRAEEALQRNEARQALLAGVAERLLRTDQPQSVVDDLCRRALDVLDCGVFFNYLVDEASGRLRLNAYGGIPAEEAELIRYLDYGAAVCGCVARDGCRIVAEAIPEHPDPRTDLVAGYGVRAYACHPLVVAGRTIGTLSFGTASRDAFTADDLATMKAIADLIAVAMQRIADRDALLASEERLRLAQESAGVGIYDRDATTDRVTISPLFLARYCVPAGAFACYRDWVGFVHPDDRDRVEADRRSALDAGRPFDLEFRVLVPSGGTAWLQFRGQGIRDDRGALVRVLGVLMDVTERKQAEQAMKTYAERLATSNEELQRFAYVASHDLQEPLRSIVSFSQLLDRRYKGRLGQDADEYIGFIVEGGTRMQRLIQDLLTFSRVETLAGTPVPTDPREAVGAARRLFEAPLEEVGARLEVGELLAVVVDPRQLEQVVANLIGNAVKYRHPERPLEIAISARRFDGMVEFAVQDNGIGIEAEYFDRIFEMFRRLHTHDQYDGTGIGLAVVKRIVERHGGTVRVESTPGAGSTFFFTLPAA